MQEWTFAQTNPSEELALMHHFSVKSGGLEFVITVREYHTPRDPAMKFFAEADRQTNQKTVPYTPCGWGRTLLEALSECVNAVHRFPYEG
ncbi:MAG: hypothetical protein HYR60_15285 [Acidobacteria bacterium]|nr:hypothetical protein [Acidobacteriota bacterium]MBI3470813.1 hypothetical protein [Candidatus Solibacter usitatus]